MIRVVLEDTNGMPVLALAYDAEPSERCRELMWDGRNYRQREEQADGWHYRDVGHPQAPGRECGKWLTVADA